MPTPMPIIDATWTVKSGVSTTAAHRPTEPNPMPMPITAVMSGSPAAMIEPKAISRITAAASRPKISRRRQLALLEPVAGELDGDARRRAGAPPVP